MSATAPEFDGTQACAGVDTNVFFPAGRGGGASRAAAKKAKAFCEGCPFVEPCLEYALHTKIANGRWIEGVWGQTATEERAAIRRRQRAAA